MVGRSNRNSVGQQPGSEILPENCRRHERRAYAGKVLRIDGPQRECGALNLSAGGVGLLATDPMEVGQGVSLAFLGESVSVLGFVSHVRPMKSGDWRVGVRFLREEPELAEVALAAS
jgi:hypothetical protein